VYVLPSILDDFHENSMVNLSNSFFIPVVVCPKSLFLYMLFKSFILFGSFSVNKSYMSSKTSLLKYLIIHSLKSTLKYLETSNFFKSFDLFNKYLVVLPEPNCFIILFSSNLTRSLYLVSLYFKFPQMIEEFFLFYNKKARIIGLVTLCGKPVTEIPFSTPV